MEAEDPPETVLRRANHLHDVVGFGTYDPLTNNCFHFAFYCKTGRRYDGPVTLVVVTSDDSAALPLRVPPQYVVAPPQYVVAPPPSPPRRRDRDWDWGRFELPQPSFRTIAAVGAVGALVVLMPELAPFAFI